jgi:hypothetical protein
LNDSQLRRFLAILKIFLLYNRRPALYRIPSRPPVDRIVRMAEARGWMVFHLDGRQIIDKSSFVAPTAHSLRFPAYFGHNWDAFEELITDLSWAPARGYLLIYDHVSLFGRGQPEAWQTACAILAGSIEYWQAQGVPLVVILRHAGRTTPETPWL